VKITSIAVRRAPYIIRQKAHQNQ